MAKTLISTISKSDQPPNTGLVRGDIVGEAEITHVGILEGGMASGKTSVGFTAKLRDGVGYVFCETSAELLMEVAAATEAAMHKFGDYKK